MPRPVAVSMPARVLIAALMAALVAIPFRTPSPVLAASLGPLTLVSVNDNEEASDNQSGNNQVSMSDDGRYVVHASHASNLVAEPDSNGIVPDIFVRDLVAGTTQRVNVSATGVQANDWSQDPEISADGRYVTFSSLATNLIDGEADLNGTYDIFVVDRDFDTIERVSVNSAEEEALGSNASPAISDDGNFVAFQSTAQNLAALPPNTGSAIFLRDRSGGTTTLVPTPPSDCPGAGSPAISAEGTQIAFLGLTHDCINPATAAYNIYVYDTVTQATETASLSSSGNPGLDSQFPEMSADGRYVVFHSRDQHTPDDTDDRYDVYLRDRVAGTTERISVSTSGGDTLGTDIDPPFSGLPVVSDDGRYVAFQSNASNLVANDTNNRDDIFVRDRAVGATLRVSVSAEGFQAGDCSGCGTRSALTGDAQHIAYASGNALVAEDTNANLDVYARDLSPAASEGADTTAAPFEPVSTDTENDGATPSDPVETAVTSPDGGEVSIDESGDAGTATPPSGYAFLGGVVTIEAPLASAAIPLSIDFVIDPVVHGGLEAADIVVFRDGVAIVDCDPLRPDLSAADPDPCISARSGGGFDDAFLKVLTSHASEWNFGFVTEEPPVQFDFAGFFQPVDNGVLNRVKAGAGVPVKFSLGGDQGLDIFEDGYPLVTQIACPGGAVDTIEQTVAAAASSLSYNATSGVYTYSFKTQKSWAGTCRQLELKLTDGSSHVATFNFTK